MTTYSKIILTKTDQEAAVPTTGNLDHGELAINYRDGKLYFKDHANVIKVIGSAASITKADAHDASRSNPHVVTKAQIGLGNVNNTADENKIISFAARDALALKADVVTTYNKTTVDGLLSSKIGLTNLSVSVPASPSGSGSVSYNQANGVFTYTPPALASNGLTVGAEGTPDGNGALSYSNGVFTYTPPTLAGLGGHLLTDLSVTNDSPLAGDGSLTYDNATGQFIYDQPTLEGLGGNAKQDVNLNTVVVDAPNYPVTSDNRVIFVDDDAALGAVTLSLPPLGSVGEGFILDIKKIGSTGNVTITANGAETIDNTGVQSIEITDRNQAVRLISWTGGWKILSPHRITGWANYYDSASATTPVLVGVAASLQFQIDGLGNESISDYLPEGVTTLWDTTINDNKIIPAKLGDAYDIRITFKADPSINGALAELVLDIGTTLVPNTIVTRTIGFPSNALSAFTVGFPIGVTQGFLDNGGRIYFNNIGGGTIDISDISLFIKRDFSPV